MKLKRRQVCNLMLNMALDAINSKYRRTFYFHVYTAIFSKHSILFIALQEQDAGRPSGKRLK